MFPEIKETSPEIGETYLEVKETFPNVKKVFPDVKEVFPNVKKTFLEIKNPPKLNVWRIIGCEKRLTHERNAAIRRIFIVKNLVYALCGFCRNRV